MHLRINETLKCIFFFVTFFKKKYDFPLFFVQGSKRGCFSQVGYQGGYQILNLSRRHPADRGCFRLGTVVHELLHTLGFFHMQSSPDRDEFIDVLWDNIIRREFCTNTGTLKMIKSIKIWVQFYITPIYKMTPIYLHILQVLRSTQIFKSSVVYCVRISF